MQSRVEQATLLVLVVLTAGAVAGYATYALHPERLRSVPAGAAIYGHAMALFPRAHILVGLLAVAVVFTRFAGWRWVPVFAALYAASLLSELLGTTIGLPFGPYHYTPGLGPMWFGHVPVLIPASWFTMAFASFVLTRRWLRVRTPGLTILAASVVLVAWDLVLDPAMSRLTPYWVWEREGQYFGMPWLNLVGWYVTGLALMAILLALRMEIVSDTLPRSAVRSLALVYAANLALPMGIAVAGGMGAAAAIAVGVLLLVWAAARVPDARAMSAVAER